jgi:hypothetical protein
MRRDARSGLRWRLRRRCLLGASALLSASALSLALSPSAGASSGGATITVSGVLQGKLSISSSDCEGTTAKGGQFEFMGHLKGLTGSDWTVTFDDPHAGTWNGNPEKTASSFVLQGSGRLSWATKSGSYTTKGGTGTANVELAPEFGSKAKGDVHVDASWNCPTGYSQ